VNDFEIFCLFTIFCFEMLATSACNLIISGQAALKTFPFAKENIGKITQNICSALSLIEKKNKNFNYRKRPIY